MQWRGRCAVGGEGGAEFGIDLGCQHAFGDGEGCGIGEALAGDEAGLYSGSFGGGGDGLAATVDDDDVCTECAEGGDLGHDLADLLGDILDAAADFDDGKAGAECGDGAAGLCEEEQAGVVGCGGGGRRVGSGGGHGKPYAGWDLAGWI